MKRDSCKGCEYSQKCELVKMTKEERKRREEIEEEVEKCGSVKEADPKKELGRALANLQNIGTVQIPKLIEELSGEDEEMAMAYIIKYAKFMENIDNEEVAQKIIDDLMK